MKQVINQNVQVALNYLAGRQQPSGGFGGLASAHPDMRAATATDTIFFTALIADCLTVVAEATAIRTKTAKYLLEHKSEQWTWNYWQRGSQSRPYPDDLDDTACSIAALVGNNTALLDPTAQAALAQTLIACEVKPGGPYVTWLMPPEAHVWRDIDVAVNANIGHMFDRLGIQSAPLEAYITNCLKNDALQSRYYCGMVPTLYFIARWYRGSQLSRLQKLINQNLSRDDLSALELAMLITAASNIDSRHSITTNHISALLHYRTGDHWPAAALYYEPPQQGRQHYAGSAELTTAFAVEALATWQLQPQPTIAKSSRQVPATFRATHRQLLHKQQRPEIITIANTIARAGGWKLKESSSRRLNRGSRNGWLAYTIYDDFLDGEGDVLSLSLANFAMRQSVRNFKQAVNQPSFDKFVEATLEQVDAANDWEVRHARNPNQLPNYGRYARLAQRSWGHVIAPTGVMVLAGYALDSPEVKQLQEFFRQYIIAKQLCDDAHDWLSDLRRGHITPVVTLVLQNCPSQDEVDRQVYFWQITIDEVNQLIRQYLARAQKILNNCPFIINKTELQSWLTGLDQICTQAEQARGAALEFMQAFSRLAPQQIETYN